MADKTFNQTIEGYFTDINKAYIPSVSGVYFVYICSNSINSENLILHSIIYIGESEDINVRINKHEKYEVWKSYLVNGQELCFSYTEVDNYYRNRLEAAYIFRHKPTVNTEYVDSFPFDRSIVLSSGETIYIDKDFTVKKT